jgi:DNA polymerase elongation subunit (family B)
MFLIEPLQREHFTELVIFSRDKNGEKQIDRIKDFRPYFYVPSDCKIPGDYRISSVEKGYVSIFGEELSRIYVMKSSDVRDVRELFPKHYEADILIAQRYIVDVLGEVEVYPLKTLAMDIETEDSKGFPDSLNPIASVVSCSFCDNKGKKKAVLFKNPEYKGDCDINEYTTVVDSEEKLLYEIIRYIREEDPDVITGWNVIGFDLMYLIARMAKLKIEYKKLSPLNSVKTDVEREEVSIRGRIVLDGLAAYSHFRKISNQGKAESYSLEFTAQDILGTGKIKHKDGISTLWKEDPKTLIEYNMRDSELVIGILNKLEIVEFFNYIRAKSCAQYTQIYQTTSLVDGFLLRRSHNKIVMPSKNKTTEKKYPGAFVFPPRPGLYNNVFVFDVHAMYPNIIKTFNMGPETFNPDGVYHIKDGIGFDKGIGLISQIMRELDQERDYFKKLKANATDDTTRKVNHYRQYAVKVLMNSFYGYLGYPGSRLYKKEIATAITETGQELIKWTAEYLQELGYEILYGDTDSIYVLAKTNNLLKLLKEGNELLRLLNASFKEFSSYRGSEDCTLEMEFEKIFKSVLFVAKKADDSGAKKKYAYIPLWTSDGDLKEKIKFTGFDNVRSDNPRLSRDTQKEVLNRILMGSKKDEIVKYLTELERNVKNGTIPIEDISFPKGITKDIVSYGGIKVEEGKASRKIGTPPVIKGVLYSNKYLGTNIGKGSKPKWIYIKKVPKGYPETNVIAFEDEFPKGFIPDYELIIEKLFKNKLEAIFKASGFGDFPNINHTIKKLSDFEV